MRLSDHIDTAEVACRCGCGLGTRAEDFEPELFPRFEALRALWGGPLLISSGARCAAHNAIVKSEVRQYDRALAQQQADASVQDVDAGTT